MFCSLIFTMLPNPTILQLELTFLILFSFFRLPPVLSDTGLVYGDYISTDMKKKGITTFSSLTVSAYEIFIEAKHLHNPIILSKQEQHERGAAAHLSKQTADR